jgi:hypothetical protein
MKPKSPVFMETILAGFIQFIGAVLLIWAVVTVAWKATNKQTPPQSCTPELPKEPKRIVSEHY